MTGIIRGVAEVLFVDFKTSLSLVMSVSDLWVKLVSKVDCTIET